VLNDAERHVAPSRRVSRRIREAHPRQLHVTGLPRMRLAQAPRTPLSLGYSSNLLHDQDILQPAKRRCPRIARREKGRSNEAPPLECSNPVETNRGSRRSGTKASAAK
jgi:hypothetical protein